MKAAFKTLLYFVVAGVIVVPAIQASERLVPDDYLNLLRIDLRATKAEVVTDAMELSAREAEVFWPLYQEYDESLSRLNAERINMIREFTANFSNIDNERAREFSRRSFEFSRRRMELLERYTRRIDKAMSPVLAARFAQVESQLLMIVDVQLASDFPLIPRQTVVSQNDF